MEVATKTHRTPEVQVIKHRIKKTYPNQFWAKNYEGILWVNGWDDIYDKKQRLYKCTWIKPGEINNRRPWCKRCAHQNFKDLPFPEPPHVKDTL
ncbi:hypothetical protein Pst134EB_006441 [Puccinia striiformis f. sp. tritici]|nr:hypothetical protein Pst134EB_006441 [Puccinia striiformis f. sp. tritici]